jgi:hypothetical protein
VKGALYDRHVVGFLLESAAARGMGAKPSAQSNSVEKEQQVTIISESWNSSGSDPF